MSYLVTVSDTLQCGVFETYEEVVEFADTIPELDVLHSDWSEEDRDPTEVVNHLVSAGWTLIKGR